MKYNFSNLGIIVTILATLSLNFANPKPKPVIIAYVGGFRGLADVDSIHVKHLSHINYAFVDIKDNRVWLHDEVSDTINLRRLTELRRQNSDLKIMISIGGWSWSKNFSDAVLTDTSRKAFAMSAVEMVAKYKLDGVDIDWEYPGMIGDSNTFRPEDKQHYTLLFKELRKGLDSLHRVTTRKYFLTTAAGSSQEWIDHTEMSKVQIYTDYINLMAYDFAGEGDVISNHHTNLYASSADTSQSSSDKSVRAMMAAGVPANKLVLGLGFYGKGWEMESTDNNGLFRKIHKAVSAGGFDFLKDSLINKKGFLRYWDSVADAPYIFNPETKVFITYDDEQSVGKKCDYVKKYNLGGAMFWEYNDDKKEFLLSVVAKKFNY